MTEDEMVGWHHQLNGHEFEKTPGESERQGTQACCSPWIWQMSNNKMSKNQKIYITINNDVIL